MCVHAYKYVQGQGTVLSNMCRVGRIYPPYMTLSMVKLPAKKTVYTLYSWYICTVLANHKNMCPCVFAYLCVLHCPAISHMCTGMCQVLWILCDTYWTAYFLAAIIDGFTFVVRYHKNMCPTIRICVRVCVRVFVCAALPRNQPHVHWHVSGSLNSLRHLLNCLLPGSHYRWFHLRGEISAQNAPPAWIAVIAGPLCADLQEGRRPQAGPVHPADDWAHGPAPEAREPWS